MRFFELEPYASRLRASLQVDDLNRDVEVIPGDCNAEIHAALAALRPYWWAPTFAFVDPNGPDVHWSTLRALAGFKKPGLTKTEIWLLLAAGLFSRNLRVDGTIRTKDAQALTAMYGTDQWTTIHDGRVNGALSPATAREEYVNLMRWRLERVLGYQWTHPLEILNEGGSPIYHMIFATDSQPGTDIMTSIYRAAANEFPAMRRAARARRARLKEEAAGVYNLFGPEVDTSLAPVGRTEQLYQHAPPWEPFGTAAT